MITHHTFLHNKVSIFPQHNNIKIKIHIKSCSQQTKLVLNVDFEGEGTCQLAPFHLRCTHRGGSWCRVKAAGSAMAVEFQQKCSLSLGHTSALAPWLIACPVRTQGALSSSPCATSQGQGQRAQLCEKELREEKAMAVSDLISLLHHYTAGHTNMRVSSGPGQELKSLEGGGSSSLGF